MIGASRSAALRETDESADALRLNAAAALEWIPSLATHEVATTWTGLRPFSHDDRPYIGWLEEGVAVCAGHGSEGVLTGGGSGRLIAQIVDRRRAVRRRGAVSPRPMSSRSRRRSTLRTETRSERKERAMSLPDIVSREEWLVARKQLLADEKEMTRTHDRLAAKRRMLPMVLIDKEYVFDGPDGPVDAARHVRRAAPADRPPLHVRAGLGEGLPELHRRRGRDVRRPAAPPERPRDRRSSRSPGRRSRSSRRTRRSGAGRSRSTRRTAATSTTTST